MKTKSTLQASHDFVLAEAKANVAFVKSSPANVEQAKQINAALANIVAMERNKVMNKAIDAAYGKNLPQLPGD